MPEILGKGQHEVRPPYRKGDIKRGENHEGKTRRGVAAERGETRCHQRAQTSAPLVTWNPEGKLLENFRVEKGPVEAKSEAAGIVACNKKTHPGAHQNQSEAAPPMRKQPRTWDPSTIVPS